MLARSIAGAVLLGLAAAALVLPATALAAKPTPGGSYGDCKGSRCKVNQIKVSPDGAKVVQFRAYTRCNPVPIMKFPVLKITPAGTFAFAGQLTDVINKHIKVQITGRFVSASEVRGTMRFSTASCNSKTQSFHALLGKGIAG